MQISRAIINIYANSLFDSYFRLEGFIFKFMAFMAEDFNEWAPEDVVP